MPRAAARKTVPIKHSPIPPEDRFDEHHVLAYMRPKWEIIPISEAQLLYAQLKNAFEEAGRILNARLMNASQTEFYECFMAGRPKCCAKGTKHRSPARGTDYENGHRDPKTGLVTPVLICGENCWIRYQELLINERRERNLQPRNS